jgi:hypothetical protein
LCVSSEDCRFCSTITAANWRDISSETEKLLDQNKLPERFDDWEDDDKLGCDDAEDFECDEDVFQESGRRMAAN